ncbi:PREDICTED: TOX high mobility group box family member 4 [Nanorana parkeri]|uniref:TOX high mobility group box family member 4 n=1 Tax=Nanorana parkeri TaxID=125878 RepID=UPI00085432D9|nr:PREDICTED: TOX high mobility group box family member 4 [Nanorana parkeri]
MDLHFFPGLDSGDGAGLFSGEEGPSTALGSQHVYGMYGRNKFPGGSDSYLTITGSGHPFLTGTETFHTPSLGDEEFEIPPISLDSDPSLAVTDVVGHFDDLGDPTAVQEGAFAAQYGVQTLDMPVEMSHEVIEQTGGLLGSGLTMDLDHPIVTTYSANPPVTIDVTMTDISSGLLAHSQLTTIDQSELSSQLGLSLGGGTILPPVQSPEDHLSPTPSPTSSLHDEDMEDFRRITAPKNVVVEQTKKQKASKKRKKKDPNEPQKPLSAYALFFRDTQAAIKGQNPNATFGEVSKIVASMWDSLGEEQKQVYKRKTEAAKKDYLKALALYKENQMSQVLVETLDLDPPGAPAVLPESPVHSPSIVTAASIPQSASSPSTPSVNQVPTPPPAPTPPQAIAPQPSIAKIIISKQMLQAGQIPTSIAMSQGMVTVIPATVVTSRGLPLHQLQPSPQTRVTRSVLQAAMQMPPRLQPPPLQQMQQPPRLQQMAPAHQPTITILQPPPPLQPMQKVRLSVQPPPLQIKIIPPPLQPQPQTVQVQAQTIPIISVPCSPEVLASPEHVEVLTEVVQEESSPPQMDVQLVSGSPPRSPSPQPRCVRSGCENSPVESKDWDNEYCSNECVVKHCRDAFMAWVAARNQGTLATVK